MMNKKGDNFEVEPIGDVFREAQVVRLYQPEMEMTDGSARRAKHGSVVRQASGQERQIAFLWKAGTSRAGARNGVLQVRSSKEALRQYSWSTGLRMLEW